MGEGTAPGGPGRAETASDRAPMIEIENLRKLYGQHEAVKGITFTVRAGEILGFLGPNGAGKSTTMKVMTCLTPPTSGSVRIASHDVLMEPLEVRKAIGFLPENPPLYPEMVVEDYLSFAAEIRRVRRGRRKAAVDAAVEHCGLTEVRRRLVGNLSKGFRQRVGLAQAVIHEPRILILDEPTVGLDPTQVIEIRTIIRDIGQDRTVILSSHILPEVQATCQRVVIINRGQIVAEGPMEELLHRHGGGSWHFTLRRPPAEPAALTLLPGLAQLYALGGGKYRAVLVPGDDARESFVRALAAGPWGLVEFAPETTTLEEVFREVVLQEARA